MIKMNKPKVRAITKERLMELAVVTLIVTLILIAGKMGYEDEVAQLKSNCDSAAYVNDNNVDCGG